ncbi:MAG: hypothetical protein IIB81_04395 [Nanoarchaeota archaeon]|nr:hypothetical protein [Nanoarchaeota archaeon]
MDKKPDLDFIIRGTETIIQGDGILAMFCPHDEYCSSADIDTNCFYEKFLHCVEARTLELRNILNQVDKFYLKYFDFFQNILTKIKIFLNNKKDNKIFFSGSKEIFIPLIKEFNKKKENKINIKEEELEGLKIKDGSFSLTVDISLLSNAKGSEHFSIMNSEYVSENEVGKLEFLTDPESDVDDYKEEFKVCADVRKVVERYFERYS